MRYNTQVISLGSDMRDNLAVDRQALNELYSLDGKVL